MASIDIRTVHKIYDKTPAVRGVDLEVEDGEFVVILGPSGCGKSTLLRMIAGLEDISTGQIAIRGQVVNDIEPAQRGCAMVFQNYALYPHMTVAQNIGYALKVSGVKRQERDERVRKIAATLGLETFLDRKPSALSGGQRQRVAMGRAMVRQPGIFLFDEPLSNLDAKLRIQIRLEIKRLHRELGTTSVFVTHDQVEAMTLADKLVVMKDGLIEQVGTPSQVYRTPQSRFVASFLGSPPMNFLPATIDSNGRAKVVGDLVPWPQLVFDLPRDTRIDIGFRPAAARLTHDLDAKGALPFTHEMIEDLGSELHLHGAVASIGVAIALPAGAEPPSNSVAITIAPGDVHAFLANDGSRVEAQQMDGKTNANNGVQTCQQKSLSFT